VIDAARRRASAIATILFTVAGVGLSRPAFAQHDMSKMTATDAWTWTFDARVYLDENLQERKFTDFHQFESQNWFMAEGAKSIGRGRFFVHGMASLEPFTLRKIGSAEVFQTGETYQNLPLVDYQHPHDLVMGASVRYDHPLAGAWRWFVSGGPVDAPALGPESFMHRVSAEGNPTAPLGHHNLDATHISHDVITAGAENASVTLEASAFHGREPDEHRLAVEFGPIDSYASRVTWHTGSWHAQASYGHLKFPDPSEFTDVDRTTMSVAYANHAAAHPIAALVAVGVNREPELRVTTPALLGEVAWHGSDRDLIYARGEWLKKDILNTGGYDPPGFAGVHPLSTIAALTGGYARTIASTRAGSFRAGADVTVYGVDDNLQASYGRPLSIHVLLTWGVH
jgi:hypothetical protein